MGRRTCRSSAALHGHLVYRFHYIISAVCDAKEISSAVCLPLCRIMGPWIWFLLLLNEARVLLHRSSWRRSQIFWSLHFLSSSAKLGATPCILHCVPTNWPVFVRSFYHDRFSNYRRFIHQKRRYGGSERACRVKCLFSRATRETEH